MADCQMKSATGCCQEMGQPEPLRPSLETVHQHGVERDALAQTPALDALAALAPAARVKIIAEVKRASPSRGALAEIRDPAGNRVGEHPGVFFFTLGQREGLHAAGANL